MESVTFDGNVLSDKYRVLVKRGIPYREAQVDTVPGMDGNTVRAGDYAPMKLSLVFVLGPCGNVEMMRRMRGLMADLDVDTPRKLELGEDGGLWCMAMPAGERDWNRHITSGSVEVPFAVVDAAMYGREMSVTVPSGGSVEFIVGGTYPSRPRISAASAVRDSSSLVWGLRLDDGDFMHVETGSPSGRKVEIDCSARTMSIADVSAIPTLDSDWLALKPGNHELAMDNGTGAATVKWFERWL